MSVLTAGEVLALVPQQRPMRFIDKIVEIDEEHVVGSYTWRPEDCAGYSADARLVPPFKLIEMAAQVGNVAWCIYHMALRATREELGQLMGVLTQVERCRFAQSVYAGERVLCLGWFLDEGYFRGNKLVSEVVMRLVGGARDGQEIFSGLISGLWVPKTAGAAD